MIQQHSHKILKSVVRLSKGNGKFSTLYNSINNKRSFHSSPFFKQQAESEINIEEEFQNLLVELRKKRHTDELTPKQIVELLDEHVVGQTDAKRSVAIALRNRWRRKQITDMDIIPKNILMIGPTGCGKTEIARRMAKIVNAPFLKVEATKYTELGYRGRDVDTIGRDLIENSIQTLKQTLINTIHEDNNNNNFLNHLIENKLLQLTIGKEFKTMREASKKDYLNMLRNGELDHRMIEISIPSTSLNQNNKFKDMFEAMRNNLPDHLQTPGLEEMGNHQIFDQFNDIFGNFNTTNKIKVKKSIKEARKILLDLELEKLLKSEQFIKEAIYLAENDGIVFIDEIDKICSSNNNSKSRSKDPSGSGVQKDLLPLIEGTTISTKYGKIETDHVLFICSGAFHSSKPSDLMAELQGRLPVRVQLKGLNTKQDLLEILLKPKFNLILQNISLLKTENINLEFTDKALEEIADISAFLNSTVENLGARRLIGVVEIVLEEISYHAPTLALSSSKEEEKSIVIDEKDVKEALNKKGLLKSRDISKYLI
ncbi:hypothetical protein ABK040_003116 [Willaertia magna]